MRMWKRLECMSGSHSEVLEGQFMNFRKDRSDDEDLDTEEESSDCVDVANGVRASGRVSERVKRELKQRHTTFWSRLVEQRWFMSFFMCLTFYALFVPDLEKWLGNKVSYVVVSAELSASSVLSEPACKSCCVPAAGSNFVCGTEKYKLISGSPVRACSRAPSLDYRHKTPITGLPVTGEATLWRESRCVHLYP